MPQAYAWITYSKWAKKHGDVMHIRVLGNSTIILNSLKAAMELLDKRSSNYSDRPRMVMASELMDWGWDFAHMNYADDWRRHRRRFHQYFQPRNLQTFYPIQKKFTVNLLEQLLKTPDKFQDHIKQHVSSIVLNAGYGYEVEAENDFYIALVHKAVQPLLHVVHAGNYLVDYIPALKYIPSWFPGAKFKTDAATWAVDIRNLVDIPFEMVKKDISKGVAKRSFVYDSLDKLKTDGVEDRYEEEIIKNCAGMVYLAGSDTTTTLMQAWILAMANYPEVQKKAQAEIDKVVGRNRLPDFNDRPSMPFVEAMLQEAMRWGLVTPLALPHRVIREDVYEGYRIPAGATVVANVWAILHDEGLYPEPFEFKPERFITGGETQVALDPAVAGGFGYGRRICPGRYLATNTAWLAMASILSAFDILKAIDANGNVIEPVVEFTDGLNSHPKPYEVRFAPRSSDTKNFIDTSKLEVSTVSAQSL
ncbi:cytochrome P450 [Agrocybe pediades]|nr:cytochrome P450 [Agrocybe pediades]